LTAALLEYKTQGEEIFI